MNLKTTIYTKLNDTLRMCSSCGGSNELETVIKEMLARINEPLRVAVVGVMKAGKSTLLNAIMKEKILMTGSLETTYTVSWFKYAAKPGLKIILRNGEGISAPFEDLAKWTVRDAKKANPRIDHVKYVEIYYPSEVLKTMELIDTPGLLSTHEIDSNNTLDFLALNKAADEATKKEASSADAIIYAFTRGAQQSDVEILQAFQGENAAGNTSPINAIGVYTKSDIHWNCEMGQDPFESARQIADNLIENPVLKDLLYSISPVSALMVESIAELNEEDWQTLYKLSKLNEYVLLDILFKKSNFMTWEISDFEEEQEEQYDEETKRYFCSAGERGRICAKCGQYGIYEITGAIRANISKENIVDYLYEKSGIKGVQELISQHFGNRAFIIKLQYIFTTLLGTCSQIVNKSNNSALIEICQDLKDEIYNLQDTEQIFRELKVLQNYYNNKLKLKSGQEVTQLLQITGEYGGNCEARLGAQSGTSIKSLADIAGERIRYWNARANEIPNNRYYEEAANILSRSCDIMHYHLQSLLGVN